MSFDNLTKLRELDREIAKRKEVYPRLGKLPKQVADRRIAILEEIADEYRAKIRADIPQLFDKR